MHDIVCIGHITLDKVITDKGAVHMAGGTSFYFSNAMRTMDLRYQLVTILAKEEMHVVSGLRASGIEVQVPSLSAHTVYFENDYSEGMDNRSQRILQRSNPFTTEQLQGINARIFHLGPLLADDIPLEIIRTLAGKGRVSLDVQGYLRRVENKKVFLHDWSQKKEALPYIHILKANEPEMHALTGCTNVREAARMLFGLGVKEIVITLASRGSIIYNGVHFYEIPAYSPFTAVVDATGCGDTYMAGYLSQRIRGTGYQHAGEFAAAMATLKIESSGPFTGTEKNVRELLVNSKRKVFLDL
jgi:sugar/nucleoside kinase (ribokinase family)